MSQIWVGTLLLFLGINLSIYFLGGAMATYDTKYTTAYNESEKLILNTTSTETGSGGGMWDYLIGQFLNPLVLATTMVAGVLGRYLTGSNNIAIFAAFSGALVGWYLNPMGAVSALGLVPPFNIIVSMILTALLLITIVDFVRG
jgi:hypothetical protein